MRRFTRSRIGLIGCVTGLAALVVAAVIGVRTFSAASTTGAVVPVVNRGNVPASRAAMPSHRATPVDIAHGAVLALSRLGVRAAVVAVADPGGVMDVPLDPKVVGWWSGGARPGSGTGHVVIVGHINYSGVAGALGQLPSAEPGDAVTVSDAQHRTVRYRIAAVRTYRKSEGLPADLFADSGAEELVLITCGGPFDPSTGSYEDNIVAIALPARS